MLGKKVKMIKQRKEVTSYTYLVQEENGDYWTVKTYQCPEVFMYGFANRVYHRENYTITLLKEQKHYKLEKELAQ